MHVVFMPYGKKELVDRLLMEMSAQKHFLTMRKGKETQGAFIESQVRMLPFGFYEYVFPKEDLDIVLNTLGRDTPYKSGRHDGSAFYLQKMGWLARQLLKLKKVPRETDRKEKFLWLRNHVSIMVFGIREDGEVTEPRGMQYEGFTHEAI